MKCQSSIDIGTHSVRLLVAEINLSSYKTHMRAIEITRLGEGLEITGRINDKAISRTISVVKQFVAYAKKYNSVPFIFGTAALREAENGIEVADQIFDETGIPVAIISAEEEAYLTYKGATLLGLDRDSLVIDIGGGSTEFISARVKEDGKEEIISFSQRLGSVRNTERIIHNDPPTADELKRLREDIRSEVIEGIAGRRPKRLYGVAGSVTQLAALELKMERYDPLRVNGLFLSKERINNWIEKLSSMTIEERL